MTYENKAEKAAQHLELDKEETAELLGKAYLADAITKGLKRLAKVIDNISIEVQEEE